MGEFPRELQRAVRALMRQPGFALAAVLVLGLGIGAATALFAVVDGVLLRPLPYPRAERIVWLREVDPKGNPMPFAGPNFHDLQATSRSFAALAEVGTPDAVSVTGGVEPVRAQATAVSGDFFRVMGVGPLRGRGFLPEERTSAGAPAVIVSYSFWQHSLDGGSLAGRTLRFDDRVFTVVGVMPPGFDYPRGTGLWVPGELWPDGPSRTAHNWSVVGRLADGATLASARAELRAFGRGLRAQYGDNVDLADVSTVRLKDAMVAHVRTALLVLLGAAALLLLIAVANVGNLVLARLAGRRRELALRLALGARLGRVTRQFLAESLVLTLGGGALGALLAYWGTAALLASSPSYLPRVQGVSVDGRVFVFALAVALLAALALTLMGALAGAPRDLHGALAPGERSLGGRGSGRPARDTLVVVQTGLTLVLLAGAALMARTLLHLLAVDPGFRAEGVLVVNIAAPRPEDATGLERVRSLDDRLLAAVRALPGVQAAGGISDFPLQDAGANGQYLLLSRPDEAQSIQELGALSKLPDRTGYADWRVASDGYFRAMGIPLRSGRLFSEQDAPDAPVNAAVVSESFARKQWPGQDPLGRVIEFGNMDGDIRPFQVVGVVGDVRAQTVDAPPDPALYAYYRQRPRSAAVFHLAIRTRGDTRALIPMARRAVRDVDPTLSATFGTAAEIVGSRTADRRFSFFLLVAFGCAALLLAVAGIYGVVSYVVAQRTREIGLRLAFGARGGDVVRLVVGRSALLALLGIALGVPAALALGRLLSSLLYGVSAADPWAYAAGALLLGGVALLASYVPARRAARVDPMIALRSE